MHRRVAQDGEHLPEMQNRDRQAFVGKSAEEQSVTLAIAIAIALTSGTSGIHKGTQDTQDTQDTFKLVSKGFQGFKANE